MLFGSVTALSDRPANQNILWSVLSVCPRVNRALQLNISAATFESSGINTGIELRPYTEAFLDLRNGLNQFKVVLAHRRTYLKYQRASVLFYSLVCRICHLRMH